MGAVAAPFGGIIGFAPPTLSMAGHTDRLEEHDRTPTSSGLAHVRYPQRGDALSVASMGVPQAGGLGHSRADREPFGLAPPLVDTRGTGHDLRVVLVRRAHRQWVRALGPYRFCLGTYPLFLLIS